MQSWPTGERWGWRDCVSGGVSDQEKKHAQGRKARRGLCPTLTGDGGSPREGEIWTMVTLVYATPIAAPLEVEDAFGFIRRPRERCCSEVRTSVRMERQGPKRRSRR